MTWGEFVRAAEEAGVRADDEISYMDFTPSSCIAKYGIYFDRGDCGISACGGLHLKVIDYEERSR